VISAVCPRCKEPILDEAVLLWNDRHYCRSCVEAISPDLYTFATEGGQLVDLLEPDDISVSQYWRRFQFKVGIAGGLLFLLPLTVMLIRNNAPLEVVIGFQGICLSFVMFYCWWISCGKVKHFRTHLPRKVVLERLHIKVVTPDGEQTSLLTDCQWKPGTSSADEVLFATSLKQGMTIYTPDAVINCGHSSELLKHWCAFFRLVELPVYTPSRFQNFLSLVGGGVAGYLVGLLSGKLYAIELNNPAWEFLLPILGILDGVCLVGLSIISRKPSSKLADQLLHPALWGAEFFKMGGSLGFLAGFRWGIPSAIISCLICGSINAIIGGFAAWHFRSQLQLRKKNLVLRAPEKRESKAGYRYEV
tara:strand:+ start:47787 stop:48869 length:1083 start_codon:yes stop_codon:yes gene_type:complete